MKFKSFSLKCEKIIYSLLNLFAAANIFLLFIPVFKISKFYNEVYTDITIYTLILYLICRIATDKNFLRIQNIVFDLVFILLGLLITNSSRVFQFYLLGRQTFFTIRLLSLGTTKGKITERLAENPAVLVLFTFFLAIFVGSLLLLLPNATVEGKTTSVLGALFTSTSATCVTGLIVYDTGTHFTLFGQSIILFLIQIGGLGIMTVSSAFAIMLGQKMSLKGESVMQDVVNEQSKVDMISLVKSILIITFIFELLGALQMYFTFSTGMYRPAKAIYYSIFHSVSAFCNAGFCLYSDSFMRFNSNFNINFVITSLIIVGGIGFPVLADIRRTYLKKFSFKRLSLHTKIVLTSTLFLIILGTIGFYFSEMYAEMKGFSFLDRIYASYFQSVTTRTAGFNTIDNANLSMSSVFLSIILMFIGASPGSTGGGIKTTAFIVIVVSVLAMFRGNRDVNIFNRRVSNDAIKKVMALIAASITFISFMIFLLLMFEPFSFEKILFEAFSAFGTVGLSMGITSKLSDFGQIIITLLMYLGRVGPLTLIFAISERKDKTHFKFVSEKITIG